MKLSMRSKGFSLIEVLMAMLILAISLLALAGLMVTTTRHNSLGGHMTEASTFAQDKLEQLRGAAWASIIPGGDTVVGATGIRYTRNWVVATNANGNQAWVTITMNWTDPTANTAHSITFRGVISQ